MWPLAKTALFTVLVPGTVAVVVPLRWLNADRHSPEGPTLIAGILLIAAGVAGYMWCAMAFAIRGRGTPAPIDPPRFLVGSGAYRLVRNPMYEAVALVLAGEAVLFRSSILVLYCVCVLLLFHLFVCLYEEPALRKKFGASYEAYCREVPRWIPTLRQRHR